MLHWQAPIVYVCHAKSRMSRLRCFKLADTAGCKLAIFILCDKIDKHKYSILGTPALRVPRCFGRALRA